MAPAIPHIISGAITKGPLQDSVLFSGTITGVGQTVNLTLDRGTSVGDEVTITFQHTLSSETLVVTTDSEGRYVIDVSNLSTTWQENDEFTIRATNVVAATELLDKEHRSARAYRQVLVDGLGNDYTTEYPLPVTVKNSVLTIDATDLSVALDAADDSVSIGDGTNTSQLLGSGADEVSNDTNQVVVGSFNYGFDGVGWSRISSYKEGNRNFFSTQNPNVEGSLNKIYKELKKMNIYMQQITDMEIEDGE